MIRLRALTSFACKEVAPSPGQVFDCSDDLAKDLIAANYAVKEEDSEVEAVATSQQDEPAKPAIEKAETKQTKKEETKNDNKSGDKKRAVSTAKGKRSSSK